MDYSRKGKVMFKRYMLGFISKDKFKLISRSKMIDELLIYGKELQQHTSCYEFVIYDKKTKNYVLVA